MCRLVPPRGTPPSAQGSVQRDDPLKTQCIPVVFSVYEADVHAEVKTVFVHRENENAKAIFRCLRDIRGVVAVEEKIWKPHVDKKDMEPNPLWPYYPGFGNHCDINQVTIPAAEWVRHVYTKLQVVAHTIATFTFKIVHVDKTMDDTVYSDIDTFIVAMNELPPAIAEDEVPKEDVVELKRRLTTLEEDVRVLKQKLASVSSEGAAEGSAEGAAAAP